MRNVFLSCLLFAAPLTAAEYDVCVYGGTSGGVAAAIQTARMGKSVVLIEPSQHIGGLTSGGLGWTDSGDKSAVGGLAREFYQRVKKHYDQPGAWKHEKREQYKFYREKEDAMWTFEPHVAEKILRALLEEHKVKVVEAERLDRSVKGVVLDGKQIKTIRSVSGNTYSAQVFIDATYEGDLMALAGVSYTVGREANNQYGEKLNGVQKAQNVHAHRFTAKVDPYVKPGDPKSGLLFGIETNLPNDGEADHRVQAYCYRLCMSNVADNRVPFPKPKNYDESRFELLLRNFEAGDLRVPIKPDMMPNGKTDTNNNCAFSTDYIGQNYKYPEASDEERAKILEDHETYQKGLMWTLQNHERVPKKVRDEFAKWGLPKDEFTDHGGWPHQIYVREARRMVGGYVMTEADCRRTRVTPEPIGMGSYNMDSHNCTRYVTPEGFVQNEGDIQVSPGGAYSISYQCIIPKAGECPNLLVPVCLSSSHIAYGSIRMEPVFMVLGQSAATAAVQAIESKVAVQKVDYAKLKEQLLKDKQVLELARPAHPGGIDAKSIKGIVIDDEGADLKGFASTSSSASPFVGTGYRHDGGEKDGKQSATFAPNLPTAGKYEVRLSYSPNANRATNVPVTVKHAEGEKVVTVNQRQKPAIDGAFVSLGTFMFEKGTTGSVTVTNVGVDGYVVLDAVVWIPVK